MQELWVEKFRPKKIDEYVFRDEAQKTKIQRWISSGALPHMLLSGAAGTGKTTLAKMLLNELNINNFDILEVNASKNNGVEYIRDTITRFSETMGYGDMKYVLLDEADYLSINAQATLRHTLEKYSANVRFILTCNYPNKIIPAIHSRCEAGRIHIDKLDRDIFTFRLIQILESENIKFDINDIDSIVEGAYPDMRSAIGRMQSNSYDGVLHSSESTDDVSDYKIDMIALFQAKRFKEARTLITQQASPDEYEDIYRFLYQNIEVWAETEEKQDQCILVIRDGLVKHTSCADIELNLSATLIELAVIARS